jgi:hypothetical protein
LRKGTGGKGRRGGRGREEKEEAAPQLTTSSPYPHPLLADARKHWAGLISGYYARRASLVLAQAMEDAGRGLALNLTAVAQAEAGLAYEWGMSGDGPHAVLPGFLNVSWAMREKYRAWFEGVCGG